MSRESQAVIQEEMKALKQKMADLQAKIISKTFADKLTVKVGAKGGLVIYGLGKFPVNLYATQAARLAKLLNSADFQEFVQNNAEHLAKKAE